MRIGIHLLLCLLATAMAPALAYYESDDYCEDRSPLRCGSWALEIDGGIAPTIWTKRGNCCTGLPNQDFLVFGPIFALPKYNTIWHIPAEVSGKLNYAVTDYIELFAEANYRVARGHCKSLCSIENQCCVTSYQTFSFSKYQATSAYAGARYYSERLWCDRIAPFIGGKIGFTHHNAVTLSNDLGLCGLFYQKNNVVSGGGLIGFDWNIWSCLSFMFTAEAVATGSPLRNLLLTNPFVPTVRIEVVFPIIFGLKYTF